MFIKDYHLGFEFVTFYISIIFVIRLKSDFCLGEIFKKEQRNRRALSSLL